MREREREREACPTLSQPLGLASCPWQDQEPGCGTAASGKARGLHPRGGVWVQPTLQSHLLQPQGQADPLLSLRDLEGKQLS